MTQERALLSGEQDEQGESLLVGQRRIRPALGCCFISPDHVCANMIRPFGANIQFH